MLGGLRDHAALSGLLPFAALFYARRSRCLYYDASGQAHEVLQGEGEEQGDPLMPGLYAVGQGASARSILGLLGGQRSGNFIRRCW